MNLQTKTKSTEPRFSSLSSLNKQLETNSSISNFDGLWLEWIWKCDPDEAFEVEILMNRCHLIGLLICRHMSASEASSSPANTRAHCNDNRMVLVDKHPSLYTLRELKDTVDNLLIEWPLFVQRLHQNPNAVENCLAVASLVDNCFVRLGSLANMSGNESLFNDPGSTEPVNSSPQQMRLSRPGLRRLLGSFVILYRHIDLLTRAAQAPGCDMPQHDWGIRKHHIEASTDDFHLLCMNMLLPVSAKLNYKQDFPGMYNHVSQVVYFHNNQYERTQRLDIVDIMNNGDPMHALPAVCQIHPEIGVAYEDDHLDLSGPTGKWNWMILPRRIYLIDPESKVHHSDNLWDLLAIYRKLKDAAPKSDRCQPIKNSAAKL